LEVVIKHRGQERGYLRKDYSCAVST
jgi:hypothetical protein